MPVPIVPYSTALVGCTPTIGISSLCKTVDTSTKPPISYSLRITLYLQPTIKGHVLGTLIIYGALGHNLTLLSRDCELFIETKAFSGSWRSILSGTDLPKGARRQLVCCGCRNLLLYAPGATSVCCSVCNAVTSVPPSGAQMAQLICSGCHTQLMYIRSANSVQCPCCHTVNLALQENQVAHVNCGNCCMLLMYRRGGRSVKCAVCNFVTSVGV